MTSKIMETAMFSALRLNKYAPDGLISSIKQAQHILSYYRKAAKFLRKKKCKNINTIIIDVSDLVSKLFIYFSAKLASNVHFSTRFVGLRCWIYTLGYCYPNPLSEIPR